jgi:hypothetical protein
MNWPPLLLAAFAATPAVVLTMRGKAPRTCGLLAGFAALSLAAGIPVLRSLVHQRVGVGVVLLVVVIAVIVGLIFFYLDYIRGEHRSALFGKRGGGAAGAAGAGGGKANHHVRPIVTCVTLALAGLLAVANLTTITSTTGHGFSDMWASTTSNGSR